MTDLQTAKATARDREIALSMEFHRSSPHEQISILAAYRAEIEAAARAVSRI